MKKGFTLVELMVAVALMSIGILAMGESFSFIQRGIQASKNKTIASNLAQEKMQILKQKNYYTIVPTGAAYTDYVEEFEPDIPYDAYFFPPESLQEAGVNYTRYTYIQVVREDSGEIVTLSPDVPDTGMRMITVTATWREKGELKKVQMSSVVSNPNTSMATCALNGKVTDSAWPYPEIEGAVINMAENQGYRDTTNSNGDYDISVNPGNYTINVTAPGYFQALKSVSILASQTQTNDFSLVRKATGSVTGTPWIRNHLVIGQIVGSSVNAYGFDQEWVEVYNPTTWTWTMATGLNAGVIGIGYELRNAALQIIDMDYLTMDLEPSHYYLFANTTTIMADGVTRLADAVYKNTNANYPNIIKINADPGNDAATVGLIWLATLKVIDVVGWKTAGNSTGAEGDPIDQTIGLEAAEQFVRKSSYSSLSDGVGRAYDSNSNNKDFFVLKPLIYGPKNSANHENPITGTPANGAIVTCSDGLSDPATAYLTGTWPYAQFQLTSVATGTWSVIITSGSYSFQHDTVTVTAGGTYAFASSATALTNDISWGFVNGRVLDGDGLAISVNPISVTNYENNTAADAADGEYMLMVSTGYNTITANPGNANSNYVEISSQNVFVETGQIKSLPDFILWEGARITGFITKDGVNPFPGITVVIFDEGGAASEQQVSGSDGRFMTNTVSTGNYSVTPMVDSRESVVPSSYSVTLASPGITYFSSTFTVRNAMGSISGTVTKNGEPIKTGVLIVVTTVTLSGNPPAPPDLSVDTLTGAPYYTTSSNENGEYAIEVRQSTNPAYNVYAYYSAPVTEACVISSSGTIGVGVLAGEETPNIDFEW